jgi:hypothetical protein
MIVANPLFKVQTKHSDADTGYFERTTGRAGLHLMCYWTYAIPHKLFKIGLGFRMRFPGHL